MKRILAFCLVCLFLFAGCGEQKAPAQPETASGPGEMKAETFLALAASRLASEGGEALDLTKDAGERFQVPISETEKQTLYLFQLGSLELAVFAHAETDGVLGAYVRMLYDDASAESDMVALAAACASALEPEMAEAMLTAALASGAGDGEAWSLVSGGEILNLIPLAAP